MRADRQARYRPQLYIADDPTIGLQFADIDLLLKVLHQLRDADNTIAVFDHHLDVIKTADWIIDMGPEGGAGGGGFYWASHYRRQDYMADELAALV